MISPEPGDRRFAAAEWRDNPYYDYLQAVLPARRALPRPTWSRRRSWRPRRRSALRFAARQWIDAMCPANFRRHQSRGAARGARDARREPGARARATCSATSQKGGISQTDESAFEVGRNLAVTPGEVVFENELIQLDPVRADDAAQVARAPLVMVPPCINKFYILDLQPENSFVRYAVARGQHRVHGVLAQRRRRSRATSPGTTTSRRACSRRCASAREIARSDQVNALGFCVGGTLLGAALAVLAAQRRGPASRASPSSPRCSTSPKPAQIGLFIDEPSVAAREATIGRGGILPGTRPRVRVLQPARERPDLALRGEQLPARASRPRRSTCSTGTADSTNLPGPMYCYYLRNTYLENRLREPGALDELRRAGRPRQGEACRRSSSRRARTTSCRGARRTASLAAAAAASKTVRARRERPHRRRGQSGGEEQAQPLDGRAATRPMPDDWLAHAAEQPGSWWPEWVGLARAAFAGGEAPGAGAARQREVPADRARARPLREAGVKRVALQEAVMEDDRNRRRGAHRDRQVRRHARQDPGRGPRRARDPQGAASARASRPSRCPK